jgi:Uma2 family endonuclease
MKKQEEEAGGEPDECYFLGDPEKREFPHLVIEIEWSRELGIEKQEIYRRLGVRELWTFQADGRLKLRVRQRGRWIVRSKSRLFRNLDMKWLLSFVDIKPQSKAVLALVNSLRKKRQR